MGRPMADRLYCKNCGHASGYHSTPVCGYDHGSGRKRCECPKFEALEFAQLEQRLVDVTAERDAYMRTVLDLIHELAAPRPASNGIAERLGGEVKGEVDEKRGFWRCECGEEGTSADVSAALRLHQHRQRAHAEVRP